MRITIVLMMMMMSGLMLVDYANGNVNDGYDDRGKMVMAMVMMMLFAMAPLTLVAMMT